MTASDAAHFREQGFQVLGRFFDAEPLRAEIEQSLAAAVHAAFGADVATGTISGQYVPTMCARTPLSLALFDRLEALAEELLDGPVLPVRCKGVRYFGNTPWHVDSELPIASVGFAAYLDFLRAESGALRIRPGSHRAASARSESQAELALETAPGDLIAFDEHLFHSSDGGKLRLQWRADYVRTPSTPDEDAVARRYFAGIFPPDWDGGYDVDLFPSYGPDWQRSGRRAVDALRRLGVYELADAQEAFARSRRAARLR